MPRAIRDGETREEYGRWIIAEYNKLPPITRRGQPRKPCKYKEEDGKVLCRCAKCEQYLPDEVFLSKEGNHRDACFPCHSKICKEKHKLNAEKIHAVQREIYYRDHEKTKKKKTEAARRKRREEGRPTRKQSRYEEIDGVTHRLCTCCDKMLTLDNFAKHGKVHRSQCKTCRSPKDKEWRGNNIERLKQVSKNYAKANAVHLKEKSRIYREENADKIKAAQKEYYANNSEVKRQYSREWYEKNKDKVVEYTTKNRERINERHKKRTKERIKVDKQFALGKSIRSRISSYIKQYGGTKRDHTVELLGCSIRFFMDYLESLFTDGMTWENRGAYQRGGPMTWHIDHIKPCVSFDLTDPEQQKECFSYKNCQPLWAVDNMSKNARLDWQPKEAVA